MLGVDALTQERWRQETAKQRQQEHRQRVLQHNIETNTLSVSDDNGSDVANLLSQMGRPLTCHEVMKRLKKCNHRFVFEQSVNDPTKMGVYIVLPEATAAGTVIEQKKFICGMEFGIMPEFSVLHKKKHRVPNPDLFGNETPTRDVEWQEIDTFAGETRGWRTVLARLLHGRFISEADVTTHFGWTPSRQSAKWYQQTT